MEELVEVQNKYERERRTRMLLEEKVRSASQVSFRFVFIKGTISPD